MKILHKYFLKEFLLSFFWGLVLFCSIFLISEFFFRLTDFIKYKATFGFILKYLFIHVPLWIRDTTPIAVLLGIVFTLNRFNKFGETIAIKSCGINLQKIFVPVFFVVFIFVVLGVYLNMEIVPGVFNNAYNLREIVLRKRERQKQQIYKNLTYKLSNSEQITIGSFVLDTKTLFNVIIDTLSRDHTLIEQIKAEKMVFTDGKWKLENVIKRKFDNTGKELLFERKYNTLMLDILRKPEDFIPSLKEIDMMTTIELKEEIEKLKRNGEPYEKELVAYYMRFSYPFSSIIVLFIGIPFALGLSGKYVKLRGIGYVLVISFFYWSLLSIGRALAETGLLPPFLGAWFSNIIFLIVGLVLFRNLTR